MFAVLIVFVAAVIVQCNLFSVTTIVGTSMEPTLESGNIRLFNHLNKSPGRYDIVTVKVDDRTLVKRVYGLPGDYLELIEGTVYVNGNAADGRYDYHTEWGGQLDNGYVLGEDEYFILGDNRSVSYDSRSFGAVDADQIRAVMVNPNGV